MNTLDWLMDGDPSIRWQTLRDLCDDPGWEAERSKTAVEGWGARLIGQQDPDGRWGGGIYSPKWTSSTYTLLNLIDIGIPPETPRLREGAEIALSGLLGAEADSEFMARLAGLDRCIVGMALQIAAYFGISDERLDRILENLLNEQMPDGGWNCRRGRKPKPPHHSSFHTTFNVLEGIREWLEARSNHPLRSAMQEAEGKALELMLAHRLYKSDKTGRVINDKFPLLTFPHRWHYDVLRGLSYFARVKAPRDARLEDAIELLRGKREADGTWPNENRYSGRVFFQMESVGKGSRWNTLRALRVLKWWESP